jgi:hypothetical protein
MTHEGNGLRAEQILESGRKQLDWAAGIGARSAYPGFSHDPGVGFEHLQADLAGFCAPLIAGTADEAFRERAAALRRDPRACRRPFLPS